MDGGDNRLDRATAAAGISIKKDTGLASLLHSVPVGQV